MKSRNGSAAIVISIIVVVFAVSVIVWAHYLSQPKTTLENVERSTPTSVATPTSTQTRATTTPAAVATSSASSPNNNLIGSLETCSKKSGTIAGSFNYYFGSNNGAPVENIGYSTNVNIEGVSNQKCVFTVQEINITSFVETALGKAKATASAATMEAQMQQTMSSAPAVTCTISQSTVASVAATFRDPTRFDAFLNSSACSS